MKLRILLVCDIPNYSTTANTLFDHVEAIVKDSSHKVFVLNKRGDWPYFLDLSCFDVVVIHYSIFVLSEWYLGPMAKKMLKNFSGLKVQMLQDEYRFLDKMNQFINEIKIDVLFSVQEEAVTDILYPKSLNPNLRVVTTLTGYIPEELRNEEIAKIADRPMDVFYRGRKVPFWLGKVAQEKWMIGTEFKRRCEGLDLHVDIAWDENERIYGDEWVRRIKNTKAVLGVESKASLIDRCGEIYRKVEEATRKNPKITYSEIEQEAFPGQDGKVLLRAISPRCFEAAVLKTALILFPGEYSGILKPWRHYIVLNEDFSNFEEVIRFLKDDKFMQEMVDTTYLEIAQNPKYSYKSFKQEFDQTIEAEFRNRHKLAHSRYLHLLQFKCIIRVDAHVSLIKRINRLARLLFTDPKEFFIRGFQRVIYLTKNSPFFRLRGSAIPKQQTKD